MGERCWIGRVGTIVALALWAIGTAACAGGAGRQASEVAPGAGHLIIIGGALSAENEEIYGRMVQLAGDGPIGIVPTASGVPDESLTGALARFDRWGGAGRSVAIDIRHDQPEQAANPEWAARIATCRGIFFTGGVQTRILNAFRPEAGDTVCHHAVQGVLAAGGFVAGSSAGAAMMSDPMIAGGTSRAALRFGVVDEDDADRGVRIGRGMGYFPYGLTDQHFLARGRLGRLIVALEQTGLDFGYGVEENRAIHADLARHRIEAIGGPHAVLMVDVSRMQRQGTSLHNVRLALLSSGDAVSALDGRVVPAPGRMPATIPVEAGASELRHDNAWGRNVIPELMADLVLGPAPRAVALDPDFEIVLSTDAETRRFDDPEPGSRTPTIVNLRLDIRPRATGTASVDGSRTP